MNDARRDALRRTTTFATFTAAQSDRLDMCFRWRSLAPGEVLFRHGDPGETMVLVSVGKLSVRLAQSAGEDAELGQVGPGELLGEMSCIDPAPRSATVVAIAETTVGELSRRELSDLRSAAPDVYSALVGAVIRGVTHRLREVDERIEQELGGAVPAGPPSVGSRVSRPTSPTLPGPSRPNAAPPAPERSGLLGFLDRFRRNA